MSKEVLHFTYSSIGNIVNLCCTTEFERGPRFKELGYLWYKMFSGEKGDKAFEALVRAEYPEGCNFGIEETKHITEVAIRQLEGLPGKDGIFAISQEEIANAKKEKAKNDVLSSPSWVYCKPLDKAVYCRFGDHTAAVIKLLGELFGESILEMSEENVGRTIRTNFEIRSDNTTLERLARDAEYIRRAAARSASEF